MFEFMQNAFYLFMGVLCLAGAGVIVAAITTTIYKVAKGGGKRGGTRKD